MALVEPIPDRPAATARLNGERALVIADYHAGIEAALRYEHGVEVESRAADRRERLRELLDRVDPDRIVFLGDLMHSIGGPGGAERGELEVLLESLERPVTVVKGNHDGGIEAILEEARERPPGPGPSIGDVTVTGGGGARVGGVGFVHGHAWPAPDVLSTEVVCVGHEHPHVRLVDEVGGRRVEPAWLRGPIAREPFDARYDDLDWPASSELIVVPAFNDLVGGTWINAEGEFLAPFLPDALADGEAYLLDGTRLGPYDRV